MQNDKDRLERFMRQCSRSLTPKERITDWNLQLDQGVVYEYQ